MDTFDKPQGTLCPVCGRHMASARADALNTCVFCRDTLLPDADGHLPLVAREGERARVVARVALAPGFRERYQLGRTLGSGASGMVLLATERATGRAVAVKFFIRIDNVELLGRFLREGELLQSLDHPHVIRSLELAERDGYPYLVTEYMEGGTLAQRGPVTLDEALAIAADCLAGLEACHGLGIVHRDLKPENVLFTADGRAKIGDLGVARALDGREALTTPGLIIGTPRYMSPEGAKGEPVGPRADLYAMGVMLYELIAGRPPFHASELMALLRMHCETPAPRLSGVPEHVADAVAAALAKDPRDRPASAAAFARALREPGRLRPRRRAWRAAAALVLAVAGGLVAVVRPPAPPPVPDHGAAQIQWDRDFATAVELKVQREFAQAEPLLEAAVRQAERFGPGNERLAGGLVALADLHSRQERFGRALPLLERAVQVCEKRGPAGEADLAMCLRSLAMVESQLRRAAPAERHARQALAILERRVGPTSPLLCETLSVLGGALDGLDQLAEAQVVLRRALAILEAQPSRGVADTCQAQDTLGVVLIKSGRADEGVALMERSLAAREKTLGPNHFTIATSLAALARAARERRDYAKADALLARAAKILDERHAGLYPATLSQVLASRAWVLRDQSRFEEALPHAKRALAVLEPALPADSQPVASASMGVAIVLNALRRNLEAAPYAERAVAVYERHGGAEPGDLGHALQALVPGRVAAGRAAEAVEIARRAAAELTKTLGPGHADTLDVRNSEGAALAALERWSEAEAVLRGVVAEREKTGHAELPRALANLAATLVSQGRAADAAAPLERAVALLEKLPPSPLNPMANALLTLATALLQDQQLDRARAALDRVDKLGFPLMPNEREYRLRVEAKLAQLSDDEERAIELLEGVSGPQARMWQAALRARVGERDRAREQLTRLLAAAEKQPDPRAALPLLVRLGHVELGAGDHAALDRHLARARQLCGTLEDANSFDVVELAALQDLDRERLAEARAGFERVLAYHERRQGAGGPDARSAELLLVRAGAPDGPARVALQLALFEQTHAPDALGAARLLEDLADAQRGLGHPAEAVAPARRALAIREKHLPADHRTLAGPLATLALLPGGEAARARLVALVAKHPWIRTLKVRKALGK